MASVVIGAPGPRPCTDEVCRHGARVRRLAAAPCRWCGRAIGYRPQPGHPRGEVGNEGEFYRCGAAGEEVAHTSCELEAGEGCPPGYERTCGPLEMTCTATVLRGDGTVRSFPAAVRFG